jgi:protein SCO1/2
MKVIGFAIVCLSLALGGALGWWLWSPAQDERLAACRATGGGTVGADIGGAFTLTSHAGRTITDEDLLGRPTLMYFGYTFCPDFCPIDVANMVNARDMLAEKGIEANMAFITVDPARDTQEVLTGFVENLHPDLVGLRGTPEQTAEAAREWRVYYAIAGDRTDPYYLVDHSTFTYLMGPDGAFLDFFRHGTAPAAIADRVACYADALS